ncbi:MAG: hypothetical protein WCR52_14730 [Bacteroidota bacterium]
MKNIPTAGAPLAGAQPDAPQMTASKPVHKPEMPWAPARGAPCIIHTAL